jgi:hypothetical protein
MDYLHLKMYEAELSERAATRGLLSTGRATR